MPVDQSAEDGWVVLGEYAFDAETDYTVRVDDNTGEGSGTEAQLVVDALRIVPLDTGDGTTGGDDGDPATTGAPDPETTGAPEDDDTPDPTDTLGGGRWRNGPRQRRRPPRRLRRKRPPAAAAAPVGQGGPPASCPLLILGLRRRQHAAAK